MEGSVKFFYLSFILFLVVIRVFVCMECGGKDKLKGIESFFFVGSWYCLEMVLGRLEVNFFFEAYYYRF